MGDRVENGEWRVLFVITKYMTRKSVFRKLKKTLIVLLMIIIVFAGYVVIVNQNSRNMTYRQKVLKAVYPAWMWWAKLTGKNTKKIDNLKGKAPIASFYDLKATGNNGNLINFSDFKGKKVTITNFTKRWL